MVAIIETIVRTLLSNFILIMISALFVLCINFLFPTVKRWTHLFLFIVVLAIALQPAIYHFEQIRGITETFATVFLAAFPILTAAVVVSGGTFSMVNLQPAMVLFANGVVVLTEKILIPVLIAALLLDVITRWVPAISYQRMAELLRTTLLGVVSAIVAAYSIFITASGTMTWVFSGVTSEPLKELVKQNVPLIGSFMTDSLGAIGKYSSGASTLVGGWLILSIWTTALVPMLHTLLTAFFYRWTAAIIEPFSPNELTGVLDDIGKTLFVLCAVSVLIAFAFIYTAIFSIVLLKLMTTK